MKALHRFHTEIAAPKTIHHKTSWDKLAWNFRVGDPQIHQDYNCFFKDDVAMMGELRANGGKESARDMWDRFMRRHVEIWRKNKVVHVIDNPESDSDDEDYDDWDVGDDLRYGDFVDLLKTRSVRNSVWNICPDFEFPHDCVDENDVRPPLPQYDLDDDDDDGVVMEEIITAKMIGDTLKDWCDESYGPDDVTILLWKFTESHEWLAILFNLLLGGSKLPPVWLKRYVEFSNTDAYVTFLRAKKRPLTKFERKGMGLQLIMCDTFKLWKDILRRVVTDKFRGIFVRGFPRYERFEIPQLLGQPPLLIDGELQPFEDHLPHAHAIKNVFAPFTVSLKPTDRYNTFKEELTFTRDPTADESLWTIAIPVKCLVNGPPIVDELLPHAWLLIKNKLFHEMALKEGYYVYTNLGNEVWRPLIE